MKKTIGKPLVKKVIYIEPDDWCILERVATFGMSEDDKILKGNKATCAYLRKLMPHISHKAENKYRYLCVQSEIEYRPYEFTCEVRREMQSKIRTTDQEGA